MIPYSNYSISCTHREFGYQFIEKFSVDSQPENHKIITSQTLPRKMWIDQFNIYDQNISFNFDRSKLIELYTNSKWFANCAVQTRDMSDDKCYQTLFNLDRIVSRLTIVFNGLSDQDPLFQQSNHNVFTQFVNNVLAMLLTLIPRTTLESSPRSTCVDLAHKTDCFTITHSFSCLEAGSIKLLIDMVNNNALDKIDLSKLLDYTNKRNLKDYTAIFIWMHCTQQSSTKFLSIEFKWIDQHYFNVKNNFLNFLQIQQSRSVNVSVYGCSSQHVLSYLFNWAYFWLTNSDDSILNANIFGFLVNCVKASAIDNPITYDHWSNVNKMIWQSKIEQLQIQDVCLYIDFWIVSNYEMDIIWTSLFLFKFFQKCNSAIHDASNMYVESRIDTHAQYHLDVLRLFSKIILQMNDKIVGDPSTNVVELPFDKLDDVSNYSQNSLQNEFHNYSSQNVRATHYSFASVWESIREFVFLSCPLRDLNKELLFEKINFLISINRVLPNDVFDIRTLLTESMMWVKWIERNISSSFIRLIFITKMCEFMSLTTTNYTNKSYSIIDAEHKHGSCKAIIYQIIQLLIETTYKFLDYKSISTTEKKYINELQSRYAEDSNTMFDINNDLSFNRCVLYMIEKIAETVYKLHKFMLNGSLTIRRENRSQNVIDNIGRTLNNFSKQDIPVSESELSIKTKPICILCNEHYACVVLQCGHANTCKSCASKQLKWCVSNSQIFQCSECKTTVKNIICLYS